GLQRGHFGASPDMARPGALGGAGVVDGCTRGAGGCTLCPAVPGEASLRPLAALGAVAAPLEILRRLRRGPGWRLLVSIAAFGWANHRDYLWMLAYVSAHGESFFANASANGVLQRALFNGDNLGWHEDAYPPFNAWVYGGTVLASLTLASGCLLWRPRGSPRASAADLMLAILTCVMASPVAWEHHYGILMPFYAVLLPALVRRPVFGRATIPYLGASYVLTSNYLGITQLTASTRANLLQVLPARRGSARARLPLPLARSLGD